MVNSWLVGETTSLRQYIFAPVGIITTIPMVGVLVYSGWILTGSWDPQAERLISRVGLILVDILILVFGIVITRQRELDARQRWGWVFLSLGALSIAIGTGLRFYYGFILQIGPLPSSVDVPLLLFYPLTFLGLLFFSLILVNQRERTVLWLDLSILAISLSMVTWYFFLASPQSAIHQDPSRFYAVAYVLGDFLLLASAVALVQRDVLLFYRRMLYCLVVFLLLKAIADSFYAFFEDTETAYLLPFLNILWLGSSQSELTSASIQIFSSRGKLATIPSRFSPSRHLLRLALPYLAVAGGLGLLIIGIINALPPDARLLGVLTGASGLVLMVLFRQYIVLRENVDLYQKMRHLATTDNLTGVYNRHFFNETLPRELDRAKRYKKSLSILILDLDDFKSYNDTYGHLRGDVVLKTVAHTFSSQLRSTDTIARFGGDEFVIILPETNRQRAKYVAGRIHQAIATQVSAEVPVGVSIGIASFRQGLSPEQLLDEADRDLYRQKANNKDKLPAPPDPSLKMENEQPLSQMPQMDEFHE